MLGIVLKCPMDKTLDCGGKNTRGAYRIRLSQKGVEMMRSRNAFFLAGVALAATMTMAASGMSPAMSETIEINRATFNNDGSIVLPLGYRNWVHVGTRINTQGVNIIDGKEIQRPEMLNAYVEPSAFAHYKKTGEWADGAQIVKDFTTVRVGDNCDKKTLICDTKIGAAIFEDSFTGLGMMVKDRSRFAKQNGYWGYFSFGHHKPPYDAVSPLRSNAQCADCHNAGAADQDRVFANAHIVLRTIKSGKAE